MRLFSNALFIADSSMDTDSLGRAIELAKQHQAKLTVLDATPEPNLSTSISERFGGSQALLEKILEKRQRDLMQRLDILGAADQVIVDCRVGRRYLEAIKTVIASGIDMVIKVAENPPWLSHFFASDDLHLLRKCPCPVYLMHKTQAAAPHNVLAAIAFDEDQDATRHAALNQRILEFAAAAAAFDNAELHVAHAWESSIAGFASVWSEQPDKFEEEINLGEYTQRSHRLDATMSSLKRTLGDTTYDYISPKTHLLHGPAESCIPELARQLKANVVVMGTVARTGIPGLIMGNTAEDILQQLDTAVLAIKPDGFESPVR